MAFFDDLTKKVSKASQTTIQKTQNMAEVVKLNSQVSDEEKKMKELNAQIGALYVSKYKDAPEADFAALVEAVKEAEAKIAEYKDRIIELKGAGKCPTCGAEVANEAGFCSTCGTPIVKAEPAEPEFEGSFCTTCGAKVRAGSKFCTSCGAPMEAE